MQEIVLGSTSHIKLTALRSALAQLQLKADIKTINAASGQNQQPDGFQETVRGALMRATIAQANCAAMTSMAVGIENGLLRLENVAVDIAAIVLLQGKRVTIVTSPGIQMPSDMVSLALKQGFDKTTVGAVLASHTACEADDPHAYASRWTTTRTKLLTQTLILALAQAVQPE